jgi:hypothetical protein
MAYSCDALSGDPRSVVTRGDSGRRGAGAQRLTLFPWGCVRASSLAAESQLGSAAMAIGTESDHAPVAFLA